MGLVDTDMAKFTDLPKSNPADVVRQVLDGIESGADEILADELTRSVRAQLNKPIQERLAGWLTSRREEGDHERDNRDNGGR